MKVHVMSYHSQASIDSANPGPTAGEMLAMQLADAFLDHSQADHGTPEYQDAIERLRKLTLLGMSWRRLANFHGPKTREAIAIAMAESDRLAGLRFRGYAVSAEEHQHHLKEFRRYAELYDDITSLIAAGYIEERA